MDAAAATVCLLMILTSLSGELELKHKEKQQQQKKNLTSLCAIDVDHPACSRLTRPTKDCRLMLMLMLVWLRC